VPVAHFQGSRLASGAVPSPFENGSHRKERNRSQKVARVSSSGSSVSAAIVEAEKDLEAQVTRFICLSLCYMHFVRSFFPYAYI
jgi:5'-3' exoribonuclease 2